MLFRYSNKFKFILMIVLGLIASFQNIIMANIVQTLTNIASNKSWDKITQFLVVIVTALTVTLVASLSFNRLKTTIIKEVNIYLRTRIFGGMLEEDKDKNNNSLGFLTNDFKLLETNRFDAQIEIIMQSFSLILALGYALAVNWLITLLFLFGSFVPMFVSNIFQKPIQESSEKWTKANSRYVNQTKNFLAGVETLKLYGGQRQAVLKNKQTVARLEQELSRMNLLNLDTNSWINFIAHIITFLMPFLFGIYLVVKGQTTLGALFAIVQLANSFVNPILYILDDRNKLATTKKIVENVDHFLNNEKDHKGSKTVRLQDLSIENLTLKRDGKQLATGVNIEIKSGEKIAVIGPSGTGKSTLLQFLLYGKYGQAKEIKLNGKKTNAGNFSGLFSYASQAPVIFADSLLFNLTLGESISREKVEKICNKLDLRNLIKEKGLNYQLGEEADKLSGGQLARIELARAILMAHPVLLLDEINASLDKKTSELIHQYLLNSNLTFIEVIHHYEKDDLNRYDKILDLEDYI